VNRTATYICSAAAGRLTTVQKTEIVRTVTAIHHEETCAPLYLVQVIFYDLAPDSYDVAGQPDACGSDMGSRRHSGRTDQRAEEPDAPTDRAGRRQGQWRRGRGLGLGRMVLVAARRDAGKAQTVDLRTSKRWGKDAPNFPLHKGESSEGHIGEYIGLGVVHENGELWQLGTQLIGDLAPLALGSWSVVLREGSGEAETTRRPLLPAWASALRMK
jgi:phenylpyruvate tautomerase PptA (4-oxalocrotonate tautomerase family)